MRVETLRTTLKTLSVALFPLTVATFALALRFPDATENFYSNSIYPLVARGFALVNRASFSLAEPIAAVAVLAWLVGTFWIARRRERRLVRSLMWVMGTGGILVALFLGLWGLNYARPSLAVRSELHADGVSAGEVLAAGQTAAEVATSLYAKLEPQRRPTELPFSFDTLNRELDEAFERIALPGDSIDFDPTPAKPLASSKLFSYLGISGIFVPFTGEPSVNALQPDAALPIVVAHEKAHQRGVTHEGEANFAAFLACAHESSPVYFRYAAYLFATRYLLGEASRYLPRPDVANAWSRLGEGPRADVRAIREFWHRYEGPASRVAAQANDRYLRTMQVPDGVQSYGTVVRLLMALERRGELFP